MIHSLLVIFPPRIYFIRWIITLIYNPLLRIINKTVRYPQRRELTHMAANKKTANRQMRELAEMGGNYAIWAVGVSVQFSGGRLCQSVNLTLYLLKYFFRRFSGHSLRQALFVYRLIVATLIGNFFDDPFLN